MTIWYAWQTHRLADESAASTKAAQRSAAAAERIVLLEVLPVAVARVNGGQTGPGGSHIATFASNVGRGTALNVSVTAVVGDRRLESAPVVPPIIQPGADPVKRNVPADHVTVQTAIAGHWTVITEYHDALGNQYMSTLESTPGDQGIPNERLTVSALRDSVWVALDGVVEGEG